MNRQSIGFGDRISQEQERVKSLEGIIEKSINTQIDLNNKVKSLEQQQIQFKQLFNLIVSQKDELDKQLLVYENEKQKLQNEIFALQQLDTQNRSTIETMSKDIDYYNNQIYETQQKIFETDRKLYSIDNSTKTLQAQIDFDKQSLEFILQQIESIKNQLITSTEKFNKQMDSVLLESEYSNPMLDQIQFENMILLETTNYLSNIQFANSIEFANSIGIDSNEQIEEIFETKGKKAIAQPIKQFFIRQWQFERENIDQAKMKLPSTLKNLGAYDLAQHSFLFLRKYRDTYNTGEKQKQFLNLEWPQYNRSKINTGNQFDTDNQSNTNKTKLEILMQTIATFVPIIEWNSYQ